MTGKTEREEGRRREGRRSEEGGIEGDMSPIIQGLYEYLPLLMTAIFMIKLFKELMSRSHKHIPGGETPAISNNNR